MTALERLEGKSVLVPFCGCRLWYGGSVPAGYGVMHYEGRQQYAHRVAWQLRNGAIPAGHVVLHRCDTPACVNVDHLRLGTHQDNVNDKMEKGRWRGGAPCGDRNPMRKTPNLMAGERHGGAKLSAAQVQEIRVLYRAGATQSALGERFGVRQCHISRIVREESWQTV